jgi:hypothetical protein
MDLVRGLSIVVDCTRGEERDGDAKLLIAPVVHRVVW